MKRQFLMAAIVAGLGAGSSPASAAGPGSHAYNDERWGTTYVRAYYRAPDSCWKVASTRKGAPGGRSAGGDIPVTVKMVKQGSCGGGSKVVAGFSAIGMYQMGSIVRIFFVGPSGKIVKTERVSIESR